MPEKAFFENATCINENRGNSLLWQHVKDITGQSQANKLPSALQSDQGPIDNPQEIIDEMNLYCAKVSDRLIKDKRSFSDRNADVLKEFINSKKPENIHFNVPLIKSDELKSILKSLDPNMSTGIDVISPKMLNLASDVLLPSFLQMINISLYTGVFPDVQKRQESFLYIKAVHPRIRQITGFRKHHSCQTALIKLINDWLSHIDKGTLL